MESKYGVPDWNEEDYAICKAYDDNKEKYKKNGGMLVYYTIELKGDDYESTRFFEWWNGKDWVRL